MTDDQRTFWAAYARTIADRLGLSHWRLSIDADPCDEDAAASIACLYGRYHATIRLSKEWEDMTRDRQRQAIVHEVLHCHARRVDDAAESVVVSLGSPAYGVFSHAHGIALEYMVDGIAEAIAIFLPLPDQDATR